jgi:HK97 family phage prohead protease
MTELEVRSFEVRAVNEDKREVTGIAVPYNETANIGGYTERFERGAVSDVSTTKLFSQHKDLIGKVVRGEDTEDGYVITAVISDTAHGRDAWTFVRDGVLDKFSVGFLPVEHRMDGDTVVRTKVNLKEVSLVPFPAYEGASLTQIREASTATKADHNTKENIETIMESNVTAPEVAELREAVGDLEREVRSFKAKSNEVTAVENRNAGELLKAIASGDDTAKRAFTGATSTDAGVGSASVGSLIRIVEEGRPTVNLFNRSALPASGNTIEYATLASATGTVGRQVAEGDDLPYMEVVIGSANAPVHTYGGYSSLSRQAIERSDVSYLETVLRFQAQQYAKATETAVRTALVGAAGVQTYALGAAHTAADAADWLDLVIDASGLVEDNSRGASAEFVLVSRDVFKSIARVSDTTGRPVFAVNGDGSNTIGSVNVRGAAASIAGLPVVVGKGLAAGTALVASREALTTFENAGAPVRLQDENIINLTKDFSLYGYLAVAVTNPLAIVSVDTDGVA